jgi:uncharacterized protein YunC (DUF1805 family)
MLKENSCMIEVTPLKLDDETALGLRVELPESPAPLVLIVAHLGLVCCGFLNMETAEKLNLAAAIVSGVNNFDDALKADVKAATSKAKTLGIEVGMKGREALKLLF